MTDRELLFSFLQSRPILASGITKVQRATTFSGETLTLAEAEALWRILNVVEVAVDARNSDELVGNCFRAGMGTS